MTLHRSRALAIALAGALGVTLSVCGLRRRGRRRQAGGGGNVDCAPYEQYGDLSGKTVTVYTGIVTPEDQPHIDSYKPFEECTGATIKYEGDKAFETQILVRAKAGNPPDIAYRPAARPAARSSSRPARSSRGAARGRRERRQVVGRGLEGLRHGRRQVLRGAARRQREVARLVLAQASSQDNGYERPDDAGRAARRSRTRSPTTGKKPWCAGIGSGEATGWPVTDWMEDMMLRLSGPEEYDKWVKHEIPFNAPEPVAALDEAGEDPQERQVRQRRPR